MRPVLHSAAWIAFAFLVVPASLFAEPVTGDAKDKKGKPHIFDTERHDPETHEVVKKKYDLSIAEQEEEFIDLIRQGLFEELHIVKGTPNPLAWQFDLAIWSIVVFVLLLFILRKLAWGPMIEGLQKREDTIRSAVEEAKEARAETERLRAQFKAEMDQAFAKIPQMMDEARRDGERLAEELRSKAMADIQAERQRLRREIETARDQALQELWTQAAQLATLISAKAIGRAISEEDHRRLVDEAVSELGQTKQGAV